MKCLRYLRLWLGMVGAVLYLAGCASSHQISPATYESINNARSIALKESTDLDSESQKIISESNPQCRFYRMAGNSGQYGFTWKISSGRTLTVSGEGDMKTLDNHKISIE